MSEEAWSYFLSSKVVKEDDNVTIVESAGQSIISISNEADASLEENSDIDFP